MDINTRISLVIPVYNELERIRDCLEAIAAQTVQPFEVIVVDNNSTDGTAAVAAGFPFVRVLTETRQGVVYARDRGFDAARGDVIGRLDADSLLAPDWVATVQQLFADPELGAVSGVMTYRDIALAPAVNFVDLFFRRRMARVLGRHVALQGASMALRRDVWQAVRRAVCHESGQHEDIDLALHIAEAGFAVRFDERLRASLCYRQTNYSLPAFCRYAYACPNTYKQHDITHLWQMYQVVWFAIAMWPLTMVLSRGYDRRQERFSLNCLFSDAVRARVNPATFID